MHWSEVDVAWMAGLLEGEGSFYASRRVRVIRCTMTDRDVIEKLHRISGMGTLNELGPSKQRRLDGGDKKPAFTWQVGRLEDQLALLPRLLPHMGVRRAAKIRDFLELAESMIFRGACEVCGADLIGYAGSTRFCSSTCRVRDHRSKQPPGPGRGNNRLPAAIVQEIQSTANTYGSTKALAEKFGIHPVTVSRIRHDSRRP